MLGEKVTYRRSAGGWNANVNGGQAEHANDAAADVPISMERRRWTEEDAEESAAAVESQAVYAAREEVSVLRGEAEERSRRSLSAEIYAR